MSPECHVVNAYLSNGWRKWPSSGNVGERSMASMFFDGNLGIIKQAVLQTCSTAVELDIGALLIFDSEAVLDTPSITAFPEKSGGSKECTIFMRNSLLN
ncbi:hypothetical protein DNTS_027214 [Danionella cerebrum]|uniref:Uncharacterized protein n=1 Tax=Danionella cerebrum TaxID=2873325 RepID=A0A553QNA8_9TELE|nr:hypothetical protein DNTS_027214 [Danionella translucida]